MHSGEMAVRNYGSPVGRSKQGLQGFTMKRGVVYGGIIIAAMLAFELFNYSTTDFALTSFLGDLRFVGLRWAMILAIAFCGMDFAGIARLFTPERGRGDRAEVWYLLAAWFLAATMNAMLTWWGVSLALLQHAALGNEILSRSVLLSVVPVFVAIMVWLIRILLIGMMSMAGERLFSRVDESADSSEERELALERAREPAAAAARGLGHPSKAIGLGTAIAGLAAPFLRKPRSPHVIGAPNNDAFERRPLTVAERHGYGRAVQLNRPMAPATSGLGVRPAPKPPSGAPSGAPPRVVVRTVVEGRPIDGEMNGGLNGRGSNQTRGNGSSGNGNGHG